MPQAYLDELRELASRPEAQLSPLSRYVLVALGAGEPVRASAGTLFRDEPTVPPELERVAAAVQTPAPAPYVAPVAPPPAYASSLAGAEFPPVLPPEPLVPAAFAPVAPPPPLPAPALAPPAPAAAPTPAAVPTPPAPPAPPTPPAPAHGEPAFGLPDTTPFGAPPPPGRTQPFGTPFALPEDPDPFGLSPDPKERAAFGWNWEPPDEGNDGDQSGDVPFGR
jgi:hypothetical protein